MHGYGKIEVEFAAAFLVDLKCAHDSVSVFISDLDALNRSGGWEFLFYSPRFRSSGGSRISRFFHDAPTSAAVAAAVPRSQQLILGSVSLDSPGFWEFIGSLNPLEVGRKYLCDRHERKKDRQFRDSAEERRLALENMLLENKFISDRIRIAKDAGVTGSDLAPFINGLLFKPLGKLDRYQDKGLVEDAKLLSAPDKPSEAR